MNKKTSVLAATLLCVAGTTAYAHEQGSWIVRAGIGNVGPESNNLSLGTVDLPGGSFSEVFVDVDDGSSLTLTGTYMFTENWAFDILAALPFSHDIDLSTSVGSVPLGETKHLPPTFSVQYHFSPGADFQPYAGLGLNYTTFFDQEIDSVAAGAGVADLDLDDSFGLAVQLGADWILNEKWLVNFDVRYINIESDATLTIDTGSGLVDADIGTVDINPIVINLSVGYRF